MSTIKFLCTNLLKDADSITANTLTNYPSARLYDKDFSKLWVCSQSTYPQSIIINQSSSPIASSCIVVKHKTEFESNFYINYINSVLTDIYDEELTDIYDEELWDIDPSFIFDETFTLYYSSDGITWLERTNISDYGTGISYASFTETTPNYWKVTKNIGSKPLRISEIMFGDLVTLTALPLYGSSFKREFNSKTIEPYCGKNTYISYPIKRRNVEYSFIIGEADKTKLEDLVTNFSNDGPFLFIDFYDNAMIAEINGDIVFNSVSYQKYSITLNIIEII